MSNSTAVSHRKERINHLKHSTFELLVLGGGATGAGIALDAASRGIKTALIEKSDFASGTSSKSTKLIHGGLRYLKQLDIQLVRETGTERAILHGLAPHLVLPEKMLMPLIKGGNYGYWSTSFGLKVYDILAKVKGDDRRKMLNKKEALKQEPLLDDKNLKGAGYYAEYRTDDARLTIELIKSAVRYGASVINYCEGKDFVYENKKVVGVNCMDTLTGEAIEIKSKTVVSATGPWVDGLRVKDGSLSNKKLFLSKGIHIVVPQDKFPLNQTVYFDVPGGRMIFAIPRGRTTYIGTTDTKYKSDLDHILCTQNDLNYLLNAVNSVFPNINLTVEDIESNWAGLRPLIHQEGKSPSEMSRKDEIFESPNGLISIAGGKLTGYRKMAERIVDIVSDRLKNQTDSPIKPCNTNNIALNQNPLKNFTEVKSYIKKLSATLKNIGLDQYHAWYLVTTYGTMADTIINGLNDYKEHTPDVALACAEAKFGIEHEYIMTASDFFVRRTGRLFFDIVSIPKIRPTVMSLLAKELDWNTERLEEENIALDGWIKDATTFYDTEKSSQIAMQES